MSKQSRALSEATARHVEQQEKRWYQSHFVLFVLFCG